jgi:lipopolysaccharide exporter
VPMMLGAQWAMAVPLVQILALAYLASAMLSSTTCLLIALEQVKALALFTWAQVALFVALAWGLFADADALQIAGLRLLVSAISDLAFAALLLHVFRPLRLPELLRGVLRPLQASACMAAGLLLLQHYWTTPDAPTLLLTQILSGAALYSAAMLWLWHAAGQPDGAEAYLLGHLKAALKTALK